MTEHRRCPPCAGECLQGRDCPRSASDGPGLLASRAFWIAGLVVLAVEIALVLGATGG